MAGNTPVALATLVSIILWWWCSVSLAAQNQTQTILSVLGEISKESVSFARFAKWHGKSYKTVDEIKFRFQAYKDNLETIRAHNQKSLSYTLAPNEFIDLTWDEFRVQKLAGVQNCSTTRYGNHKLTNNILPKMKDWRKDGIIGPVKTQRMCGACWAFSATGALEAAYTQKYRKNVSLSEQQLLDCSQAYKNFGCSGGLPSQAFEYLKSVGGIETEVAYPYTAKSGKCKLAFEKIVVKVVDSVNITMGDEEELKHAVALTRPVSVAFHAFGNFWLYQRGIYTSKKCRKTNMDVNHSVLAVGYGIEKGIPYWIIKNSWGAGWGEKGYFRMAMGENMCGVATCASYPVIA